MYHKPVNCPPLLLHYGGEKGVFIMTFGEKLFRLRKESNLTQEQLAALLSVSRQSVSKWESDVAYPETEKLLRLGQLFDCSMDYLLDESCTEKNSRQPEEKTSSADTDTSSAANPFSELVRISVSSIPERKSEREVFGMPLYHIGKNARGFFAVGVKATGVISFGLLSRGILSFGVLSLGVISLGVLSLGLLAFGSFALGLAGFGAISAGIIAAGAITFGVVSGGAISVGSFAAGALAIGKYAAVGDEARGMAAIGFSKAVGSLFAYQGEGGIASAEVTQFRAVLEANVPAYLGWAKSLFLWLIESFG